MPAQVRALIPVRADVIIYACTAGQLVWQGFGYEWLHHILGFETPHRLGSFASMFTSQNIVDSGTRINASFYIALSVCGVSVGRDVGCDYLLATCLFVCLLLLSFVSYLSYHVIELTPLAARCDRRLRTPFIALHGSGCGAGRYRHAAWQLHVQLRRLVQQRHTPAGQHITVPGLPGCCRLIFDAQFSV